MIPLVAALSSVLLLSVQIDASGNPPVECAVPAYQNDNQADPAPLSIRKASGFAVWEPEAGPAADICVAVFTEKSHEFISQTRTDKHGFYEFEDLSKGRYRLVAYYQGLFFLNAPFHVVSWPRGGIRRSRRMMLHLEIPSSVHGAGWVDYEY